MNDFENNIINLYGQKGKIWLSELPNRIDTITSRLKLKNLKPLSNLSYHYILSGFQNNIPIILKLGLDNNILNQEAFTLNCFKQYGAIDVLAQDNGFLLLQQAIPGGSLKSYFPEQDKMAIEITCELIKKIHQAPIPKKHNFVHIKNWLSLLDNTWDIPSVYLNKAKNLRDRLLTSYNTDVLLHGDLHHDNILQHNNTWVFIDPKGVIGDPAYEVGAFIRNPIPSLLTQTNPLPLIQNRIELFAHYLNISSKRISDWCFVQAVLSWAWALEDNSDSVYWANLTKLL